MPLMNFGQPVGGVIQVAFVVENIERRCATSPNASRSDHGSCPGRSSGKGIYRGATTDMRLRWRSGSPAT